MSKYFCFGWKDYLVEEPYQYFMPVHFPSEHIELTRQNHSTTSKVIEKTLEV